MTVSGVSSLTTLEKLAEAATPGPWIRDGHVVTEQADESIVREGPALWVEVFGDDDQAQADIEFIVAANPVSVAALTRAVRAAEDFAFLPVPVSSDERMEWLTKQSKLWAALALFAVSPAAEEPEAYVWKTCAPGDLKPGDLIRLRVFSTQFGLRVEQRRVVSVTGDSAIFREGEREYEVALDEDLTKRGLKRLVPAEEPEA